MSPEPHSHHHPDTGARAVKSVLHVQEPITLDPVQWFVDAPLPAHGWVQGTPGEGRGLRLKALPARLDELGRLA